MLAVNGWQLFAPPLFLDQLERLIEAVERSKAKDPENYKSTANAKLLAAIEKLIFEQIPGDPTRPEYRQGTTLGGDRKHWFRAKFGGQRFRLFFRYSSETKVIIFAWVKRPDHVTNIRSKDGCLYSLPQYAGQGQSA